MPQPNFTNYPKFQKSSSNRLTKSQGKREKKKKICTAKGSRKSYLQDKELKKGSKSPDFLVKDLTLTIDERVRQLTHT